MSETDRIWNVCDEIYSHCFKPAKHVTHLMNLIDTILKVYRIRLVFNESYSHQTECTGPRPHSRQSVQDLDLTLDRVHTCLKPEDSFK